jgi:hypothetical protein
LEYLDTLIGRDKAEAAKDWMARKSEFLIDDNYIVGSPGWVRAKLREYFGPTILGPPRELLLLLPDMPVRGLPARRRRSREGFDRLMREYPLETLNSVINNPDSPWISVFLRDYHTEDRLEFAIWKETGNVYKVHGGEVEDS